jgi:hypothetical protein
MEILPVEKWDDKRKVLLEYMKNKMDKVLKNVADKEGKSYHDIFEQNEE